MDTNIVAAAILRAGMSRRLLFRSELILYSPAFLRDEILEHEAEFCLKSGLNEDAFDKACDLVLANILIVDEEEYTHRQEWAKQISPDPDDWPFLALAKEKGCALWSNDKRLKRQKEIIVYDTIELARMTLISEP